ncbi:hypothetical protein LIS77_07235 [Cytobacillus firmus]|uniref:Uncharacterized protein n=1 Tax=Cytobacillus firmus TaxID=1399 RepID=A0A800MV61_CYTFI|nr:hypothetical protein [Cytobacillus firmus]KAF0823079.1 hypothetical protein KIS1582_3147 [Cytobacillus firmus]MDD9313191.1 hypothetical protein [Cytobacillus firmus]MEC1894728.1 hypothetical protein [Cytobacillus firmus]MED1907326.1 hypothetical protein [Cytobacillus firmus]MED1940546.1 hypothetical protein [Cytobacillus firmus]
MFFRAFWLLTGFGVSVSGGVSVIGYLNLLTTGHTFKEYWNFITYRPECYLLPIGIFIITMSIYLPYSNEDD